MTREQTGRASALSRRQFLVGTGGALAGLGALGLAGQAAAAKRHPQRGGTLEYSSRGDIAGLDGHKHNVNHAINAAAVLYTGLTDLDQQGNVIPGLAESWEPSKDLKSWVFRLRKGTLFHNGREVDAEAVKLNIERIQDPKIGGDWERGAIANITTAEVIDRYTIRLNTQEPDASVPTAVMHYPTRMIAPDTFGQVSDHPVGTGPFKFVSWTRWNETRMERFENYWETDAEGNSLPYLDALIDKPKREDSVRLTALLTGQVGLISNMAEADVPNFKKAHSDKFNIWTWHYGGRFLVCNFRNGPFQDKNLRTAAAHAINREAIHYTVYYEQGAMANQPYPEGSPWHLEGIKAPEYDPERAKSILKKARAIGTELRLVSFANIASSHQIGQVVQDSWTSVGFKVKHEILDNVPFQTARDKGAFDGLIQGNTYRYDPDAFYGRNLHSQSGYAKVLSGWKNERYDKLVEEAKRTLDPAKRKALYTEAWNIVTDELPHFYLHEEVYTSAASKAVQGYQPGQLGAVHYHGGGLRAAYIAT
jgi:peptide/nickel transport system substrate-binding protein